MQNLEIGRIICELRREKGGAQEKLAGFLGISAAAVSKWESGQSYPDITLLPELASYFGVSIDCILGFSPVISDDEARAVYRRLAEDFAAEPEKGFRWIDGLQGALSAFAFERANPMATGTALLFRARFCAQNQRTREALEALSAAAELFTDPANSPIVLVRDTDWFDGACEFLAQLHASQLPPRNDKVIKAGILQSITADPAFNAFKDDETYQEILSRLKTCFNN